MKQPIVVVTVVIVVAVALASEGRADFTLWNDEELTVNTYHEWGLLYDRSRATIVSGGRVFSFDTYDSSILDISGGLVAAYGGTLRAWGNSTVDISDGFVGHFQAYDDSTVEVSFDGSASSISTHDTSSMDISGGSVSKILTDDNSSIDISGGSITNFVVASGSSTVNISGGSVNGVITSQGSSSTHRVVFFVLNFRLGAGLSRDGNHVTGSGDLSGEWVNGSRWAVEISGRVQVVTVTHGDANMDGGVNDDDLSLLLANWTGSIPVPEPATVGLLVLFGLVFPRRKNARPSD